MTNLYVTEPGSMLTRAGGRLVVTRGGEELFNAPSVEVEQVVVLTGCGVTTPALNFLLDHGIGLVMLSGGGRFRGRLSGDLSKNVALRRQQYRRLDDEAFRLGIARAVVTGKIRNCRVRCLELAGAKPDTGVAAALANMQERIARAGEAKTRAELMGIEGAATRSYFEVVRHFIRPPWVFTRRARRPPPDPVNALFSLLSTCLHGACHGAIEAQGLDPHGGFLHDEHYGRASLALDLMEEFRPIIADATVLTLLNKQMIRPEHFTSPPEGGVRLTKDGWRIVMTQYDRRLHDLIQPSGYPARVSYFRAIETQARQLRSVIEGDASEYAPLQIR